MLYKLYDRLENFVHSLKDTSQSEDYDYPGKDTPGKVEIIFNPSNKTVSFHVGHSKTTHHNVVFKVNPALKYYNFTFKTFIDPNQSPVLEVSRKFALANIGFLVGEPEESKRKTDDQIIESYGYVL